MHSAERYIIPIIKHGNGCDYHRMVLPFQYMGFNTGVQRGLQGARLVVFNRIPNIDNASFFSLQKRIGFRYVIDLDDYWELYKGHYLYDHYITSKFTERVVELIKKADAVTVTNSFMAERALKHSKQVHVIQNALPFDLEQFVPGPRPTTRDIKFIYAGGTSHDADVSMIAPVLERHNVGIVASSTKLPVKGAAVVARQPLNKYMSVYDGYDVSIMPLVDNEFNTCKSNLKALEAGAKGIHAVASAIHPYVNDLDGKYVDICRTPSDWAETLKYCVDNPSYVYDKGAALAEHVRDKYHLKTVNQYRVDLYQSLLK